MKCRLSAVSFFNTAPLVFGLEQDPDIRIRFGVPSSLLQDLIENRSDAALLPVIDFQHFPGLRVLACTGIGCDGPTLTVRLFSRTPISQTRILAVDSDSHTSVVLARLILKHRFNLDPELIPLTHAQDQPCETRLLIGDKVVTAPPEGFVHQLDLGEAWKQLTGLPFTFAAWTLRPGVDPGNLPEKLLHALRNGLAHLDHLIQTHAVPKGWPEQLARQYLTHYLRFQITPEHLQAIRLFHQMACQAGLIPNCRPLELA